ncbi:hypothetical protein PRZ48_012772 [Zasmidium cellare]|uniref:Metallo-beta-lactamase domain-containing protein n=1 Tax=Zasmidium cellare TaxID=395010 RepID=A0ABR0E5T0_ZASCE|nr:hypothetical protein PRZ48_012772 [Zasmidium cellare]
MSPTLRASVYVSAPAPFLGPDGKPLGQWSAISSALIYSEHEAVLVDTAITEAQNVALADWIEQTVPTKRLAYIYITHGHADHWLGIGYLKKRFPGVKAVATKGTIDHMREQIQPELWNSTYGVRFPGQIDTNFVLAEPLPPNGEFTLEGHVLQAVEVGHSDTHDSTILWVPSIKLAVCGDVVYGDVHQQLRYAKTKAQRDEWIQAIEKVEALGPETVVPGHKKAGEVDGTWNLQASKEYIRAFEECFSKAKDATEMYELMMGSERFSTRFNPSVLKYSYLEKTTRFTSLKLEKADLALKVTTIGKLTYVAFEGRLEEVADEVDHYL